MHLAVAGALDLEVSGGKAFPKLKCTQCFGLDKIVESVYYFALDYAQEE